MIPLRRPSANGRRFALGRKYEINVAHYGGRVKLLTLTPAGVDLLPWGDETRVVQGEEQRLVEWIYREVWNHSAQARATRLFEAAQRAADRWVRRQWGGKLPRQLGNVRAEQKRGVWHFHYLLPYETEVERVWSKTIERFMDRAWRRELERWPDEAERRRLVEREYMTGEITRGFYGFGFVHGGRSQGRTSETAARYMARNAAGYMASNVTVAGRSRHYVSSRLTRETGVTMRALRSCNWLYMRRKLIDSGELEDSWVPTHWTPEYSETVLRVWALISANGPPREGADVTPRDPARAGEGGAAAPSGDYSPKQNRQGSPASVS